MPDGDKKDKLDKRNQQVLRGARSMLRARGKVNLPSNLNIMASRNHARQGLMPYGLGTEAAEYKARRAAHRAKKKYKDKQFLKKQRKKSVSKLKKLKKNLKNSTLNEANKYSSRSKFRDEDNKRVSKPKF